MLYRESQVQNYCLFRSLALLKAVFSFFLCQRVGGGELKKLVIDRWLLAPIFEGSLTFFL